MIRALRFDRQPSGIVGTKLVHEASFEPITDLPLSTVCRTANGARERLSALLGRELVVDVFAPSLVAPAARAILFADSVYFTVGGERCDTYVVFRNRDGHRIAAAAFGETGDVDHDAFTALETRVLTRVAILVASLCEPFAGTPTSPMRAATPASDGIPPCVTYFELRIAEPIDAVIGIGLSADPGLDFGGATLATDTLLPLTLPIRAEFAQARLTAADVASWNVGTTVRFQTPIDAPATLYAGPVAIAVGDCGINAQHHAVSVTRAFLAETRA